jgi:hypothetical protein
MSQATSPFDALDAAEGPLTRVMVLKELDRWGAVPEQKRSPELMADVLGLQLGVTADGDGPWGTRFGPWATFGSGQDEVHVPPLNAITPAMVEVWERRARAARHPVLRARYADLVWDLSQVVRKSKPGIEFARLLIDAVVDGLKQGVLGREVEAYQSAERGIDLARSVKDLARAEAVERALMTYERQHAKDRLAGTWGKSFDLVLTGDSLLSDTEKAEVVQDMERRLERLAAVAPPALDPHGVEAAAMRLARYYRAKGGQTNVARVVRVYANAFRVASKGAQGMVATAWLEKVHAVLEEYGLKADADALVPELREHGKRSVSELKAYSTTATVPAEEMDRYVDSVLEGDADAALRRLTSEFVPDPQHAEEQVRKLAKTAVLSSMISKKIMDDDGRVVAEIGPLEDDLDGSVIQRISQGLQISAMFLRVVLDEARKRLPLNADALMARVRASRVFDEEAYPLIEEGLRLYFEGRYAPAMHLLIPQIEAAVRRLGILAGAIIYKRNRQTKLLDMKLLHDLLRDEHVVRVLSEPIALYLRVLMVDQRGWNLRNEMCHGSMKAANFTPVLADRVLHALLLFLRFEKKAGAEAS